MRPEPDQAGQAEDLARADVEVHVVDAAGRAAQPADGEDDLADRDRALGEDGLEVAADHDADQVGAGEPGRVARPDERAVAQDGHAVGDPQDLARRCEM